MTLQEAKDQVAKKHGYDGWRLKIYENGDEFMEKIFNEAAELYAKEAADKAWEAGWLKGKYEASELLANYLGTTTAMELQDKETFMKELFKPVTI